MGDPFSAPDADKFVWQASHPLFAQTEADLLLPVAEWGATSLLEIGCGDGANFPHLRLDTDRQLVVGLDKSLPRLKFAHSKLPGASFVCADGSQLPFRAESFATVLLRDVLHHADTPPTLVAAAKEVLGENGLLYVLEPNGRNPIMAGWALIAAFDRRILQNSRRSLQALMRSFSFPYMKTLCFQPFPISRVLCHYKFGSRSQNKHLLSFVGGLERVLGFFVPTSMYAYIGFVLRKTVPKENA